MADDDSVEFSVVLHSATDVCTRSLCMPTFPETIGDLQRHIETKFNIPRCCQSVAFEGNTLHGDDTLQTHGARNGDTFHVYYKSDADVKEIRNIVDFMLEMLALIEKTYKEYPDYYHPGRDFRRKKALDLIRVFERQINHDKVDSLATHYFQPFSSDHAMANKLYFVDIDGLKVLHSLYSIVIKFPWEVTVVNLQHLEIAIIRAIGGFYFTIINAAPAIQSQLQRYPTLQLSAKSALRVPIKYRKSIVAPKHLAYTTNPSPPADQDLTLSESMFSAIGVLLNLSELPQYQVQIASEAGLLNQATLLALCPSYKPMASVIIISGMVGLAYNKRTHQYLVKKDFLKRIEELDGAMESSSDGTIPIQTYLRRYFTTLLYALIIASSANLLPEPALFSMCSFMNGILRTVDPELLHSAEQEIGYIWSTLRPHFILAYTPLSARLPTLELAVPHHEVTQLPSIFDRWDVDDDSPIGSDEQNFLVPVSIQPLCAEIGILSLQNMLMKKETRQVLVDEELVDYVVCLPWSLPEGTQRQQRACKLVKSLRNFMKLDPPSLVNISRAKLAADTFGLERVMNAYTVNDLIN